MTNEHSGNDDRFRRQRERGQSSENGGDGDARARQRRAVRPDKPGRFGNRPDRVYDDEEKSPARLLVELDQEIMKLLVRRGKLVGKLRGGRDHAASPAAIKAEKEVRAAWEHNATRFSRDSKFTHQLFALLQDLKVSSREEAESLSGFTLAPARKPVEFTLPGPADARSAALAAALAAGLGRGVSFRGILLGNQLLELAKALNQAGASFAWTGGWPGESRLHHNAWSGPEGKAAEGPLSFSDKGLYAGDCPLSFFLLLFLAAGGIGKTRFTGAGALKTGDFSPLRRFLPQLGARLAHTLPGSKGVPASLEASGAIPELIELPEDLDEDALLALFCACPSWASRASRPSGANAAGNRSVRLNLTHIPASVADAVLARVTPLYRLFDVNTQLNGTILTITPQPLTGNEDDVAVPEYTPVMDPELSAYLLALPAFAGGRCRLTGVWPSLFPAARVLELLQAAGLEALSDAEGVNASAIPAAPPMASSHLPHDPLPLSIAPLRHAFAAAAVLRSRNGGTFRAPAMETAEELHIAESFYMALGLTLNTDHTLVPAAKAQTDHKDDG